MQQNGTLNDVITHEMGHVIGIGTIWTFKNLLKGASTNNPTFTGTTAKAEFGKLKGTGPKPVPVENTGGQGTRNSHWRESVFKNELMTGFVNTAGNPVSRLTVGSLKDLGYDVNLNAAEPYNLPNLMAMAEAGLMAAHEEDHAHALPVIPMTLPDESLVA
jgi:hypothetical protein